MFEKVANAGKSIVDAVKTADIGTVGKFIAGGLLLVASTALTIAGTGAAHRDEDRYSQYADIVGDADEMTEEAEENAETTEEAEEK